MPSSHTATAAAYATASTIQHPLALPLVAPVVVIAWARLKTRRHFPTDVLVGAGIGLVLGMGTGILLRRATAPDRPTLDLACEPIELTPEDDRRG